MNNKDNMKEIVTQLQRMNRIMEKMLEILTALKDEFYGK